MKEQLKTYFLIVCGTAMTAAAISVFFVPNKIVNGGASGLATVLYYTFGIRPSVANALINGILLLIALLCFGWGFIAKTIFSIVSLTVMIEIFSYVPPLTDNMMLAAIFGAVLYGAGIGLVLSRGSTTGGTDILGRLVQYKFPHLKIGKLLLIIDLMVICLSLITFKTVEAVLYGIIALFISTTSIDLLIRNLNVSKLVFIITDKGEEIAQTLVGSSPRGVTKVDVTGVYTNAPKQMLICALKEHEITSFQRKILEKDEHAFIIYAESQQIVGNGFYIYG